MVTASFYSNAQVDSVEAAYTRKLTRLQYKSLKADHYQKGDKFILPGILFDLNKATLRPGSKDSLDKVAALLFARPALEVEISNHSDRSNATSSTNLTLARARACMDYLVKEKGISASRVKAQGYGNTQLLFSDAEVALMKTKEEQELARQKNRRTELRITAYKEPRIVKTMKDSVFAVWDIIALPDIEYSGNTPKVTPWAVDSLNEVAAFLNKKSNLVVEIGCHTSSLASAEYNIKLSEARARVAMDYLVKVKGIPAERITIKGYGETQPVYTDDYINRIKEPEKQMLYHRMNIRTELKVLKIE